MKIDPIDTMSETDKEQMIRLGLLAALVTSIPGMSLIQEQCINGRTVMSLRFDETKAWAAKLMEAR